MTYLKDLKPGFYHLDLDINHYDRLTNDLKLKELKASLATVSDCVKSVLKLWIARIEFVMYPRKQDATIRSVRDILKSDPCNLNALAELCDMCKRRHIKCSDELSQMNGIMINDSKSRANCLLEQSYVQMFTDPTCADETALKKMTESRDILTLQLKHCSKNRKVHMRKAMHQLLDAMSSVNESLCCLSEGEKTEVHMPSKMQHIIEQFKEGIQSLEIHKQNIDQENMYVWKFYLAMAYNRADWSIRQDSVNDTENRAESTLMCLELFWLVGINSQQQLYRGRSFAYIGHALQTRRDLLTDHILSLIERTDPNMERYLEFPLEACENAYFIHKNDVVVLTRYGKVLLNLSMHGGYDDKTTRLEMLLKSKSLLDQSLSINYGTTWFTLSTRMEVHKQIALMSTGSTKDKHLNLALADGEELFKNKRTSRDLCTISKICQILGKFHNAVFYLSYAIDRVGFRNYHVNFPMGQLYHEMGEYRKAVEWMKRALETIDPKRVQATKGFSYPFTYILDMYKNETRPEKSYIFSELKTIMTLGFSKLGTISNEIETICTQFKPEMEQFLGFVRQNPFKNNELHNHVLQTCREIFGKTAELSARLGDLHLQEENDDIQRPFSFSEHRLPQSDPCDDTDTFKYDFFVSHSKADKEWVMGVLIPALETTSFQFDVQLKGCYEDRDFTPGISIFDNIVKAVKESRRTLLICSPEYFQNRWKQYETEQSLIESLNTGRENIIPIKLRQCDIPSKIAHLVHADLTDELETSEKLRKLKRAIY